MSHVRLRSGTWVHGNLDLSRADCLETVTVDKTSTSRKKTGPSRACDATNEPGEECSLSLACGKYRSFQDCRTKGIIIHSYRKHYRDHAQRYGDVLCISYNFFCSGSDNASYASVMTAQRSSASGCSVRTGGPCFKLNRIRDLLSCQ